MTYTVISFGLFLLNFTLKCAFSEPASVLRNSCVNHVLLSKRFLQSGPNLKKIELYKSLGKSSNYCTCSLYHISVLHCTCTLHLHTLYIHGHTVCTSSYMCRPSAPDLQTMECIAVELCRRAGHGPRVRVRSGLVSAGAAHSGHLWLGQLREGSPADELGDVRSNVIGLSSEETWQGKCAVIN